MRTVLRFVASLACLAAVSAALAQEPGRTVVTGRGKALIGSKVTLKGGDSAGTVEDVVFSDEGVVDYVVVSTPGGKLVTVPWDAAKYDYDKRSVIINTTPEVFRAVPTYSTEKYPNFYAPTYREEVYKAYGMTPGAARRLERRLERR